MVKFFVTSPMYDVSQPFSPWKVTEQLPVQGHSDLILTDKRYYSPAIEINGCHPAAGKLWPAQINHFVRNFNFMPVKKSNTARIYKILLELKFQNVYQNWSAD